jgi:hypothetical protein
MYRPGFELRPNAIVLRTGLCFASQPWQTETPLRSSQARWWENRQKNAKILSLLPSSGKLYTPVHLCTGSVLVMCKQMYIIYWFTHKKLPPYTPAVFELTTYKLQSPRWQVKTIAIALYHAAMVSIYTLNNNSVFTQTSFKFVFTSKRKSQCNNGIAIYIHSYIFYIYIHTYIHTFLHIHTYTHKNSRKRIPRMDSNTRPRLLT